LQQLHKTTHTSRVVFGQPGAQAIFVDINLQIFFEYLKELSNCDKLIVDWRLAEQLNLVEVVTTGRDDSRLGDEIDFASHWIITRVSDHK
jgi:hypothetical protein